MAGRSKSRVEGQTPGEQFAEAFEERQAEGLKCLSVLDVAAQNPNQLAPAAENSYQLATTEQSELTAIAGARAWAEPFLIALARYGTILAATREVQVSRRTVYDLMEASPTFAKAVEVARQEFAELLEHVAVQRAMNGSERLLEFLLRGALPGKYRESQQQQAVNVNVGAPIVVDVVADLQQGQPVDDVA